MGKKQIAEKSKEEITAEAERVAQKRATQVSKGVSKRKKVEQGRVYVKSSYNNTYVTVSDTEGNVLAWMSAGSLGFSGPKKATPFAATKVIEAIAEKLKKTGPFTVEVFIKGVGSGRDAAVRALDAQGFTVTAIHDITPVPHNGPRPPKPRRV